MNVSGGSLVPCLYAPLLYPVRTDWDGVLYKSLMVRTLFTERALLNGD